ncbi:MAG: cupredoxin family copper-binding protein [Chloroflexi bacterium]|nr:cupredoxin family copper-binding protein [Chloroflexota bacterium]
MVTNTGGLSGSYEVILKIDNIAVATQNVILSGGASQIVSFVTARDVAGTYTVNAGGLSGTFKVKVPPAPVVSTTYQVAIRGFAFNSSQITIKVGDTITWTNQDSVPHTVTGDGFDLGNLAGGQSRSYTFITAATFTYHCNIHPYMQGQVTVGSGS